MRIIVLTLCLLALPIAVPAQVFDFECQTPPCTYQFPVGLGAAGDCLGASWNGLGTATVDIGPNGVGFPTMGTQYVRIIANGPEAVTPGIPPVAFTNATQFWVPIAPGAIAVSLDWEFYSLEVSQARNDGMQIDVIDALGNQLLLLVFADQTSIQGECQDLGAALCPSIGSEVGVPGPDTATSGALPPGSAFLRVAVWNGADNAMSSHGVIDRVQFLFAANGQAPQPGAAVMDFNNSVEVNGLPVSSGANGPYFVTVSSATPLTMHFEGPAGAPLILFAGALLPAAASFGAIGQLDIDSGTIVLVADGNAPDFLSSFFRLQANGVQDITGVLSPSLSGQTLDFQSIMFMTPAVVSLSNAVSLAVL